jgi:hypothetical protein
MEQQREFAGGNSSKGAAVLTAVRAVAYDGVVGNSTSLDVFADRVPRQTRNS